MTYREKMKENSRRIHTCSSCEELFNVYSMTFKGAQVRIQRCTHLTQLKIPAMECRAITKMPYKGNLNSHLTEIFMSRSALGVYGFYVGEGLRGLVDDDQQLVLRCREVVIKKLVIAYIFSNFVYVVKYLC